ncbi:MAG: tol-pal system protein YbgF, partial [Afipia sp.]
MTSQETMLRQRAAVRSHIFGVLNRSILVALKSDALTVFRVKMSSRFQILVCAVLAFAPAWLPVSAVAQQDLDPEMRIERLENQLRTLTG